MKIRKFAGSSSSGARRTASTATCRRLHTVATRWLFREEETVQAAQTVQIVQAPSFILPRVARLCRNTRNLIDVMLSKAKHLAFSGCYKVEILRLRPQNDIATQSQTEEEKDV